MNKLLMALFVSATIVSLSACGGGGSNTDAATGASSTGMAVPAAAASSASEATGASSASTAGTPGTPNAGSSATPSTATGTSTPATGSTSSSVPVSTTGVTPATPAKTSTSTPTTGTTTPATGAASTPTASGSSMANIPFFGVNAHYIQGGVYSSTPLATQSATESDLGLTSVRQDVYSNAQIDILANEVMPKVGTGINVMPLVIPHPWMDPSLNGARPTEDSAYKYAYNMAAYAATKFKGVPVVEFGNEYDLDDHNAKTANDGVNVSDYDNTTWPIWRGAMRGSYDGWRSVDTTGQTKIINTASLGFLNLGWYKGMLTGVQPDGTTGHPKVKTDIIQLHWYSDGLDPVQTWGKDGTEYNVLKILHDTYNLPIMFTEIGINADFSTAKAQQYITKTIPELYAAKQTYNVIGFNWYELYDDQSGTFGLLTNGGAKKEVYATMKAAVAAAK